MLCGCVDFLRLSPSLRTSQLSSIKMGSIVFALPILKLSLENKEILKHLVNDKIPNKFRVLLLLYLSFTSKCNIKIRQI